MRNKRFGKLLSAALAAAMALSLSSAALAAGSGETHLTIIGTSDTHGNIWGYSYEDMKESTGDGLARVSAYVNQVRSENPNTILVDAGDTIQGTIMTDDLYSKDTASHPVAAALNYMDYDAWTLGNHEFNFGVDTLKSILEQVDMPVLAANIKNADGSYFTGAGYTIVERGGVKLAIIGVTTPNIPRWDGTKQGVADLTFEPMADAVAACIQEIGGQADVIMVSTHAGLGAEYSADGSDAAQTILDKCPEVDVLQLGHTHTTYINSAPIPVGEAKNNAGEVVRYDLTLNADKEITSATVETVSMEGIEPDQGLRELPAVKSAQERTVSFIQDNVLGHASADFQPVDEIKGIPSGRIEDTAVIDLIDTVQLENSGADVTAVALFKDTSDLKKGDLNYGNLFDIYKYPNVLYTVKVSGAEMKAYMEWAAACWNQWKEGDVSISFNPQKPGYLHDHFIGLNYEVNLSKPAGERIENVTFQGKPLTDDMTLTLCVNDYRYTGLKNEGIISGEKEWESSASVRDMLVAYLAEHDPLEPAVDHNWKITGVDLQKDNPDRATLIELVNTGRLESPYNQSLNLDTYSEVLGMVDNVKVSDLDKTGTAASFVGADGAPYFRMRDLAYTFNGSKNQFNVSWAEGKVAITTSTAYDGELFPLPVRIPAAVQEQIPADITVSVDGTDITVPAILFDGHYYLTVDGMNALLGTNATIQEKAACPCSSPSSPAALPPGNFSVTMTGTRVKKGCDAHGAAQADCGAGYHRLRQERAGGGAGQALRRGDRLRRLPAGVPGPGSGHRQGDGGGDGGGAPPHAGRGGAQPALFGGRVPGRGLCRHRRHPVPGKHPLPGGGNRAVRPGGDRGLHLHRRPARPGPPGEAGGKDHSGALRPAAGKDRRHPHRRGGVQPPAAYALGGEGPLRPVGEPPAPPPVRLPAAGGDLPPGLGVPPH